MTTGIKLEGGSDVFIKGNEFQGLDTAIEASGTQKLIIDENKIDGKKENIQQDKITHYNFFESLQINVSLSVISFELVVILLYLGAKKMKWEGARKATALLLNIHWSILGIMLALISIPYSITFFQPHLVFIIKVKKFWWALWWMKNMRAGAIGNVIILSNRLENKDLEHELVHIEQYRRVPLIFPFLYYVELLRKGYRNNKYEREAYIKAGNGYKAVE